MKYYVVVFKKGYFVITKLNGINNAIESIFDSVAFILCGNYFELTNLMIDNNYKEIVIY